MGFSTAWVASPGVEAGLGAGAAPAQEGIEQRQVERASQRAGQFAGLVEAAFAQPAARQRYRYERCGPFCSGEGVAGELGQQRGHGELATELQRRQSIGNSNALFGQSAG